MAGRGRGFVLEGEVFEVVDLFFFEAEGADKEEGKDEEGEGEGGDHQEGLELRGLEAAQHGGRD